MQKALADARRKGREQNSKNQLCKIMVETKRKE